MITVNSRSLHESTVCAVRIAPRSLAPSAHSRKTLKRRWIRRLRDKIRLWRDEYLADAFAVIFPLGIVIAAWYFGLIVGASR